MDSLNLFSSLENDLSIAGDKAHAAMEPYDSTDEIE